VQRSTVKFFWYDRGKFDRWLSTFITVVNIHLNGTSTRRAFTLIEMIGVLAVIAILASLLVPKIFDAIHNSQISNAVLSYHTQKTAIAEHYGKTGAFDKTTFGTNIVLNVGAAGRNTNYDTLLLSEGFTDKPFLVKIGTASYVELSDPTHAGGGLLTGLLTGYDLDGDGASDTGAATFIVEAVIQGCTIDDARAINDAIDSTIGGQGALGEGATSRKDTKGRVVYNLDGFDTAPVFIYITHQ